MIIKFIHYCQSNQWASLASSKWHLLTCSLCREINERPICRIGFIETNVNSTEKIICIVKRLLIFASVRRKWPNSHEPWPWYWSLYACINNWVFHIETQDGQCHEPWSKHVVCWITTMPYFAQNCNRFPRYSFHRWNIMQMSLTYNMCLHYMNHHLHL